MDEDFVDPVVVPLTQAPWFTVRTLSFPELNYLQEQRILCRRVTVEIIKTIGEHNFLYDGATFSTPCLPHTHIFFFAQWAGFNIDKMIEMGLYPRTKPYLEAVKQILKLMSPYRHRLFDQLGLRLDSIIARLHSVHENVAPMFQQIVH
ncbi:hypothetical protein CAEBREN_01879 [Caenorhabditis brenneri]|uniref:Uncharacterized protein n=1 Tax=Caenorhabditis brenneri TaxID=135651 RepID=G0MQW3_CAEBE|nr:hypothetical protein CAEBREN_01879 [Caenorhabditis brenneri]